MTLKEEVEKDLPTHACDYRGRPQPIRYPRGQVVARCGYVVMLQTSKHLFAVVYALQVKERLGPTAAAAEFGDCCLHQAQCESLLVE